MLGAKPESERVASETSAPAELTELKLGSVGRLAGRQAGYECAPWSVGLESGAEWRRRRFCCRQARPQLGEPSIFPPFHEKTTERFGARKLAAAAAPLEAVPAAIVNLGRERQFIVEVSRAEMIGR